MLSTGPRVRVLRSGILFALYLLFIRRLTPRRNATALCCHSNSHCAKIEQQNGPPWINAPCPFKSRASPPLCTSDQIKRGTWKLVRHAKPPYIPTFLHWRNECYTIHQLKSATHWDSYQWIPEAASLRACRFHHFEKNEFCHLAANKTIAFVGDSLSLEHYSDLAHQVGFSGNIDSVWDKKREMCFTSKTCLDSVVLMFCRTFWLEILNSVLQNNEIDILILNTGAWYNPDADFLNKVERRYGAIQDWKGKCNDKKRNCQLIWRTTLPGHPQCERFEKPATSALKMELHILNQSLYQRGQEKFHWWDFSRQTRLLIESLKKQFGDEIDFLPAYDMALLRPDAHKIRFSPKGVPDCLHFCALSGVGSAMTDAFFHLMKSRN